MTADKCELAQRLRDAVAEMPHGIWTEWHPIMLEAAAALSALQSDVPREMTDAMMNAGQRYLDSKTLGLSGRFTLPGTFNWHEFWQSILDAMIADQRSDDA